MEKSQESFQSAEKPQIIETRTPFLDRLKSTVDREIKAAMSSIANADLVRKLQTTLFEFGVLPENIHVASAEAIGIGERATITLSESAESLPRNRPLTMEAPSYRIALLGALLSGCGAGSVEQEQPMSESRQKEYEETIEWNRRKAAEAKEVAVSGDRDLPEDLPRIMSQSKSPEIASVIGEECGPAKPGNAPKECGHQQWAGFSETNPAAVAWMAIANTGTEACRVSITRLELSYLSQDATEEKPSRKMLSSDVNGVQLLADGTQGGWWGKYLHNLPSGSTFDIAPNIHAYVHPFGPMMAVPEEATEVTVTFAAEITGSCIASGGMDTYEEIDIPNTEPPYTQNGRETDFIKEAMKTPWVTKTVDPNEPISYSIKRLPRDQRTGWSKENPNPNPR